ncbi:hypothetical protein [Clostridium sp.]|jgi:hypothetical protein|uniref:hypothetical protein n=1 Tax=Clostridium sp. TaxID=1506 RepID=UPI00258C9A98|nr:hypothetical protein [Clostridium sp.]MDF2505157.1 hypothetical protein [Clostridium sp.]
MDNNKSLNKTKPKSNPELRKMFFKNGGNIGIENGDKVDSHTNSSKYTKRSKLSHNN